MLIFGRRQKEQESSLTPGSMSTFGSWANGTSGEERAEVDSELEVSLMERKCPEEMRSKHRWRGCMAFPYCRGESTMLYKGQRGGVGLGGFRRKPLWLNSFGNQAGMN